jgi:hypothetical protein
LTSTCAEIEQVAASVERLDRDCSQIATLAHLYMGAYQFALAELIFPHSVPLFDIPNRPAHSGDKEIMFANDGGLWSIRDPGIRKLERAAYTCHGYAPEQPINVSPLLVGMKRYIFV